MKPLSPVSRSSAANEYLILLRISRSVPFLKKRRMEKQSGFDVRDIICVIYRSTTDCIDSGADGSRIERRAMYTADG